MFYLCRSPGPLGRRKLWVEPAGYRRQRRRRHRSSSAANDYAQPGTVDDIGAPAYAVVPAASKQPRWRCASCINLVVARPQLKSDQGQSGDPERLANDGQRLQIGVVARL